MNPNHPKFLAELVEKGQAEVEFNGKQVLFTADVLPADEPEPVLAEPDSGVSQPPPDAD